MIANKRAGIVKKYRLSVVGGEVGKEGRERQSHHHRG